MSKVISFKPRRELDAQANLDAFISFARDELTAFGADLVFDDVVWDLTETCARKGQGNNRVRITFCTLDTVKNVNPTPLHKSFISFAQAYMRQMHVLKPTIIPNQRLAALRALEAALNENGVELSPVKIDANIMNRAAQRLKMHFSASGAYQSGIQLEMIGKYMSKHGMTSVPLDWRNPIARPFQRTTRVGQEFDEKRAKKMPSKVALEVLPYVYRHATEPRDVLVSATAAILCSAPDRISEVLLLPVACETTGLVEGDGAYGLRWWPAKGADPMVKWILPSMVDVVREALAKIRKVTEPARAIARWYEKNPDQMFLPQELENLRSQRELSTTEVGAILWGEHGTAPSARTWCNKNNIYMQKNGNTNLVLFSEVENAILKMLPYNFPVLNQRNSIKYSDALMVVQRNLFCPTRATYSCMIEPVVIQHINDGLGARSIYGCKSIFDTFGLTENDGTHIRVISHQFRHYLNTLAQAGGLSQLDIAKWSGRKDIRQNEAYDHVSADEMLQTIRDAVGDVAKAIGPLATLPKHYLIRRDEFARLLIPTAHTTDFGYCVHDYTMAPCQVHLDCINCQEHVCIKGDATKTERLRQQFDEAQDLLTRAEAASKDGYWGSDRWLEHHKLTTERLRQLCEIMDDPRVPVGAVIQLNNVKSASRIEQAIIARAELPSPPENGESMVEELRALLHGGERSA